MGKALMVVSTQTVLSNNNKGNFFGTDGFITASEVNAQASCTEGATFSNFRANIISGNSGTATFQFRDAGANGNQTFQITGTGSNEDAVNTDVLTVGDLFNFNYVDTGTDSTFSWAAINVAFASGHGNFHGPSNFSVGPVYDAAGETRYIPFAGPLNADGGTVRADVQWKNRGYTSIEAVQLYVAANARTTDVIIRTEINGVSGGLSATIAGGVTGRIDLTGTADTIADGGLVNLSITLGTGVEDMNISYFLGTFKSTSSKSESFFGGGTFGWTRAASGTESFVPPGGRVTTATLTEAQARIKPGFAATVSNPRWYIANNTYTSDATVTVYRNGVATAGTFTITAGVDNQWWEDAVNTFSIDTDDEISFGITGGTSGNLVIHTGGLTFAPEAAAGQPFQKRLGGIPGMGNVQPGFSQTW